MPQAVSQDDKWTMAELDAKATELSKIKPPALTHNSKGQPAAGPITVTAARAALIAEHGHPAH